MFGDFMGKMQEAQQKMEETKKRLDSVYVDAEAENGMVKVISTANMKITNVIISDELIKDADKETIEDLIIVAINKALKQAKTVQEAEMAKVAHGAMPNIGNLFGK